MGNQKTNPMKIKTTETVSKEKEITLPYFSKDSDNYYAILSDEIALRVSFIEFPSLEPTARISTHFPASSAYGNQEITAKEFEYVYETANDYLSTQFEKMRDTLRESKGIYSNISEGEE